MSGDGINIGKRFKVVNFIYIIFNEKENVMSEKWNYVLVIMKIKEVYDNLKESFLDIKIEMVQLNEIEVDNVKFQIEYILGEIGNFLFVFVVQVL